MRKPVKRVFYKINDCMLYPDMGPDDAMRFVDALQKLGFDVVFEPNFEKISLDMENPVPEDIWKNVLDEVRASFPITDISKKGAGKV